MDFMSLNLMFFLFIRYADIQQLNNGKKIAPSGWKCDYVNCDKVNNLWLNLTDGSIYCGRKFFDGSGGNGHATLHYEETSMILIYCFNFELNLSLFYFIIYYYFRISFGC